MVKICRKGLSWANFWVSSNDKLSDFYAGTWQRGDSPVPLLLFRLVLLTLALAIFAWSLVEAGPTPTYLIFLTNWGLMLLTAMLIHGTYISVMSLQNKFIDFHLQTCATRPSYTTEISCAGFLMMFSFTVTVHGPTFIASIQISRIFDGDPLPLCMRSYWFLFNISISISFLITALYWILIYNSQSTEVGGRLFWLDIATHGLNSCIAIAELLLSRTPVRFLHFYQPLGVGLWYAAFSVIYYLAGGTDGMGNPFIYAVLDWRDGRQSGLVVGLSAVSLLLIYMVVFGIACCRDKVANCLLRTTTINLAQAPPVQYAGPMHV